ncbi:MAG: hypothetical protein ACE5OZ_10520 [Candidatus Heimdallarchaeota archaeon]
MNDDSSIKIRFQFWDSPGDLQFLRKPFFAGAQGALLAFDLSRSATFHRLDQWFDALKRLVDLSQLHSIFLVGMKADLEVEVRDEQALDLTEKWSSLLGKTVSYVKFSSQRPSRGSISPEAFLRRIATEITTQIVAEAAEPAEILSKVIVLGEPDIGKTSLINVLSGKKYDPQFLATVGADFTIIDVSLSLDELKIILKDDILAKTSMKADEFDEKEEIEEKEMIEPPALKPPAVTTSPKMKRKKRKSKPRMRKKSDDLPPELPIPEPEPAPQPVPSPARRSAPSPAQPAAPPPPPEEKEVQPPPKPLPPAPGGPPPSPSPQLGKAVKISEEQTPEVKKETREELRLDDEKPARREPMRSEAEGLLDTIHEEADDVDEMVPQPAIAPLKASVEAAEPSRFSKDCKVSYYDIMNPEKFYELKIHISDIPLDIKAPATSVLTGERRTEVKEHVEIITEKIPLVTIRPIFPGCLITPPELEADFRNPDEQLTFFVTPLVKGNISNARIELLLHNKELIAAIATSTKVVDPRIARVIAAMGFAVGLGPKAVEYGFDVNFNKNLAEAMPFLDDILGPFDILLLLEIGLLGLFLLVAASLLIKYRPHSKERKATL